jgi:DNA-3-methyladenine glycosylase
MHVTTRSSARGESLDAACRTIGPGERRRLIAGLTQAPTEAARFLLGKVLVRRQGRRVIGVRIVETEAYLGAEDAAAHAFRGKTARNAPLWGPPGTVYVYFIYGMYHCLNIAVDREGTSGCVLIRAAEPLPGSGLELLDCRGPGRLCRALDIDITASGTDSLDADNSVVLREGTPPKTIGVSPRIGISKAADRPLRFFDADSAAVSTYRPMRARVRR